ncbi:hypothetical protein [Synechococcus elongatus]|uniref:hypothetical protein n=1 Tax=Synechococcus elongatus TaxID=32046 RepID=UPI000F7E58E9|nr:hypothetical protein [Synechococcus elongatus]
MLTELPIVAQTAALAALTAVMIGPWYPKLQQLPLQQTLLRSSLAAQSVCRDREPATLWPTPFC